jgi:release factor glutamine methyltransferase
MQPTVQILLSQATHQLKGTIDEPVLEAQLLLSYVLNKPRTALLAWPEQIVSTQETQMFFALIERRLQGEPIAYLLKERAFWSLNLRVTTDTLIPRPESELLVELILRQFKNETTAIKLADLGTGSGAIALAIASERPQWRIDAIDVSEQALQVAKQNAELHAITNVSFYQGDWCAALPEGRYDAIVSNPPYLSELEWPEYAEGLAFEPLAALVSGVDGLDAIRSILSHAAQHLKPHGLLALEHGFAQGESVRGLLARSGFQSITTLKDLAGLERVTYGFTD